MNKSKKMNYPNTLNKSMMKPCIIIMNFTSEDFHLMQMHMNFKNYFTKREFDLLIFKSKIKKEKKGLDLWSVWLRKIWWWLLSSMDNCLLVATNLSWEWRLKERKKKEETGITKRSIITMAIEITKIEESVKERIKINEEIDWFKKLLILLITYLNV